MSKATYVPCNAASIPKVTLHLANGKKTCIRKASASTRKTTTAKPTTRTTSSTKSSTRTTSSTRRTTTTSTRKTSSTTSTTANTTAKTTSSTSQTKSTSTTSTSTSTSSTARPSSTAAWSLVDDLSGSTFFDAWDFWSWSDPTHGLVAYQDRASAFAKNLAYVNSAGQVVLAVDDTNNLPNNTNRASVRLHSKTAYPDGLVMWDVASMPIGCGAWPAMWMNGPNWPNGGEFDVIEGVGDSAENTMTLHTGNGCNTTSYSSTNRFTGDLVRKNCYAYNPPLGGCSIVQGSSSMPRYGSGFNKAGGGVYVSRFDSTGLYVWYFSRGNIPADIKAKTPRPSSWPTPMAKFSTDSCEYSKFFGNQTLIINTTIGGDWAGSTYGLYEQANCPGTIYTATMNATNWSKAKWVINSVRVYRQLS
ncbi:unnamed protein product [Parajaminaea phylloscopi]